MATLSDLKRLDKARALEIVETIEDIEATVEVVEDLKIDVPKETLQSLFGDIAREKKAFEKIKSSTLTDFAAALKEAAPASILKPVKVEIPDPIFTEEPVIEIPEPSHIEPEKVEPAESVPDEITVSDLKEIIDDLKKSIKEFVLKTERELKTLKLSSGGYSSGGGGAVRLSELDDVDVIGVSNNDVLTYSASVGKFVPMASQGSTSIDLVGIAAEAIDQYDFVVNTSTGVYKATSDNMRDIQATVFLASNAATIGQSVVLKYDVVSTVPFGYTVGSRILLGFNGVGVENIQSAGSVFIKPIATAINSTQIKILTESSIIRNG